MTAGKPKARLLVTDPLGASAEIGTDARQSHYLAHVMRVRAGDALVVFNGRDGEWLARVLAVSGSGCRLSAERQLRRQRPEPGPWLLFAPIKKTGVDFIAEKATEIGASRLWPVFTAHTAAARINLERLRARTAEAAEQCRRLTVPEVTAPITVAALAKAWPPQRSLIVLDETGGGPPLPTLFRAAGAAPIPEPPGLLVGPEGGWGDGELDPLDKLPFVGRATLGPRIMRAETAVLAALACWQALAGDWRQPPAPQGGSMEGGR